MEISISILHKIKVLLFFFNYQLRIKMLETRQDYIRLALLDDHQIVIDELKILLKNEEQFEVVLECTKSALLLQQLPHQSVDILITDLI